MWCRSRLRVRRQPSPRRPAQPQAKTVGAWLAPALRRSATARVGCSPPLQSARMDRILMEGMAFFGRHGVFPAERELGARFTVDVELMGDLQEAATSDHLDATINYAQAYELVSEV